MVLCNVTSVASGRVRRKDSGEIQVAYAGRVKRSVQRISAGDLLPGDLVVFAARRGVDRCPGVIRERVLVAKSRGHARSACTGAPFCVTETLALNHIAGIEAEGFVDCEAARRIIEA